MEAIKLNVNQLGEWAPKLHAGDRVLLSGTVYTSRDAAHKRYFGLLDEGKPLPFDIKGAAIYYAGAKRFVRRLSATRQFISVLWAALGLWLQNALKNVTLSLLRI